jgi:hypothetical protein
MPLDSIGKCSTKRVTAILYRLQTLKHQEAAALSSLFFFFFDSIGREKQ